MEGANDFVFFARRGALASNRTAFAGRRQVHFHGSVAWPCSSYEPSTAAALLGHILPAGRSRIQKCSVADPSLFPSPPYSNSPTVPSITGLRLGFRHLTEPTCLTTKLKSCSYCLQPNHETIHE